VHIELEKQAAIKKDMLATCKTPLAKLIEYNNKTALLANSTNSTKKKIRNELNSIDAEYKTLEADLKRFASYNEAQEKIDSNKYDKSNTSEYVSSQIDAIERILLEHAFIMEDYTLTAKGQIASQLQEVHPLVLADMYSMFADLTASELVTLFSCFSNISVKDDVKTLQPNGNGECNGEGNGEGNGEDKGKGVNALAKKIEGLLDRYYAEEVRAKVESGSCYDIQYDMMHAVEQWCEAATDGECKAVIDKVKTEKNIFLGEFVKAILKINNIAKEFEKVCELLNNLALLEKLREIPRLTLKYVVTSQSLYI
jgi:superfamily II RNA helicase